MDRPRSGVNYSVIITISFRGVPPRHLKNVRVVVLKYFIVGNNVSGVFLAAFRHPRTFNVRQKDIIVIVAIHIFTVEGHRTTFLVVVPFRFHLYFGPFRGS